MAGIYQILIPTDADLLNVFEELVKMDMFPEVEVGTKTCDGIVTAQCLLKNELLDSEHIYS